MYTLIFVFLYTVSCAVITGSSCGFPCLLPLVLHRRSFRHFLFRTPFLVQLRHIIQLCHTSSTTPVLMPVFNAIFIVFGAAVLIILAQVEEAAESAQIKRFIDQQPEGWSTKVLFNFFLLLVLRQRIAFPFLFFARIFLAACFSLSYV